MEENTKDKVDEEHCLFKKYKECWKREKKDRKRGKKIKNKENIRVKRERERE